MASRIATPPLPVWRLIATGILGGVFSGLFGVGGGLLIVPLLVTVVHLDQRHASATSLLAIIPTAAMGATSYALGGEINVAVACLVAVGAVGGSFVGTWLLRRLKLGLLRWLFVGLMVAVAAWMALVEPVRGTAADLTVGRALGMVGLGLVMGVASGLFGIGGGVIAVPALMMVFGLGDLTAKGISLLAMIPASISGTAANLRKGLVDWRAGLIVGLGATASSLLGTRLAFLLTPRVASLTFAALLVFAAFQLAQRAWTARSRPKGRPPTDS